jgi:hypothetical protein
MHAATILHHERFQRSDLRDTSWTSCIPTVSDRLLQRAGASRGKAAACLASWKTYVWKTRRDIRQACATRWPVDIRDLSQEGPQRAGAQVNKTKRSRCARREFTLPNVMITSCMLLRFIRELGASCITKVFLL